MIKGIAVDDGLIVTGSWLDEEPEDPVPWIHEETQEAPGATATLVMLGILSAAQAAQRHQQGR